MKENGEACRKRYNETGSLIIHYFVEHKLYACSHCCSTYETEDELENHSHQENINLRLSK